MTGRLSFRDEVLRQLETDILSFGWLRQIAELDFDQPTAESVRHVFDLASELVDTAIAIVGDARNDGVLVAIDPWSERGDALKERMARKVDGASSNDRNWVFWLQLADHSFRR